MPGSQAARIGERGRAWDRTPESRAAWEEGKAAWAWGL